MALSMRRVRTGAEAPLCGTCVGQCSDAHAKSLSFRCVRAHMYDASRALHLEMLEDVSGMLYEPISFINLSCVLESFLRP